ncbi:heparinase II/III domain-containing protein [Acholeplasma granularum]|uniref:heparinase II/III domain-containing protein n=1 Tax=Acholeplasma granularum TaxID=264635 RepID=UPI00046EECD3|nr:heparinase II/III family protein [Acholeplasma granularum]
MNYFDINALNDAKQEMPAFNQMIETMKKEVIEFATNFKDDPKLLSEWGHHDFCKLDGGKLIFDVNKPHDHICEICGTNNQSKLLDGVWVYNYRNLAILNIWKSAFLFKKTNNKIYLEYIYKILGFYSDNYTSFKLHNKEGLIFDDYETMKWGAGRLMPQGLNEAIITVRIINALELIKDDIDPKFLSDLKKNYFDEVTKLLIPQVDKIHNISCWKNSAIGMIGLFFNDKKNIEFAFNGTYNIVEQVKKGVTKDGFWFEGSIHYNFFTLEGIINLLLFSKIYNYQPEITLENTVKQMLEAAYYYAFDNHILPNPNDGWPDINLKTYSYIYSVATKIYGLDSHIANLLKLIEQSPTPRVELPLSKPYYYNNEISLERLILVPNLDLKSVKAVPTKSTNFPSSQYAILKNDRVNVFLKYGHNGPSHAHLDKMNIEATIDDILITRDLSNAGYGNQYCNEWHRMTPSHNTVVIDGKNHRSMAPGKTLLFSDSEMSFKATSIYDIELVELSNLRKTMNHDEVTKYIKHNYRLTEEDVEKLLNNDDLDLNKLAQKDNKEIDFTRTIKLNDDGYVDTFLVESNKEVNMDLFMHVEGDLITEVKGVEASLDFNTDGYQHIHNVRLIDENKTDVNLKWLISGKVFEYNLNLENAKLFLADTFDNPITKSRQTLIIRYYGNRKEFKQIWKI